MDGNERLARRMYDKNPAFREEVDCETRRETRRAVDSLRINRSKRPPLTDDAWEMCKSDATEYLLTEIDYIYGALRKNAHDAGSNQLLVIYHGDCEWFSGVADVFDSRGVDWGVPFDMVGIKWLSVRTLEPAAPVVTPRVAHAIILISPQHPFHENTLADYISAAERRASSEPGSILRHIEAWTTIELLPFTLKAVGVTSGTPESIAKHKYGNPLDKRFKCAMKSIRGFQALPLRQIPHPDTQR